jgi:hypothetical protein
MRYVLFPHQKEQEHAVFTILNQEARIKNHELFDTRDFSTYLTEDKIYTHF